MRLPELAQTRRPPLAELRSLGLIIFAFTCVPITLPWIACIIATVPYGAGIVFVFLGVSNYLMDAYLMWVWQRTTDPCWAHCVQVCGLSLSWWDSDALGVRCW